MTSKRGKPELSLEKKAWFLCKFLANHLDEENFEKLRHHVSICKGVKTKVKLSDKGWSTGYSSRSIKHINHRLKYETFPLQFIEQLQQDSMFVNVLLCVFRMQPTPGAPNLQYEIIAYKFSDSKTVEKYQMIFQILTGGADSQRLTAPGSSLTLVPGRQYHMGTLAPERWGSRDRLLDTLSPEINGGAQTMTQRMMLGSEGSWSGGSSRGGDELPSPGASASQAGGQSFNRGPRSTLQSVGADSMDGGTMDMRRRGEGGGYEEHMVMSSTGLHRVYSRAPSEAPQRGRTPEPMMYRGRYQSTDSASQYGGGGGAGGRIYRSRSVDPLSSGGGLNQMPIIRSKPKPRAYMPSTDRSDVMSVMSGASNVTAHYLVQPNFPKVYAARSTLGSTAGGAGARGNYMNGSFSNLGTSRLYGSNMDMRERGYGGSNYGGGRAPSRSGSRSNLDEIDIRM